MCDALDKYAMCDTLDALVKYAMCQVCNVQPHCKYAMCQLCNVSRCAHGLDTLDDILIHSTTSCLVTP